MVNTDQSAEIELEFTFLAAALPTEITGVMPKRLIDAYIPETDVRHPSLRLRKRGDIINIPVAETTGYSG